jgi:hypothetical protein
MKNKSYKQIIFACVLIGYGIFSFVSSMRFITISQFALGIGMGQGSIFVIWGVREWIGYSIKLKGGKNNGN